MATVRQDVHSPAHVVMENYTYVGSYDSNPTAYMEFSFGPNGEKSVTYAPGWQRAQELMGMVAVSTESRNDGRCDHCGAGIRYRAVMGHTPTGQVIQVGETCLENRFSLATADFKVMKKAAEEARAGQRVRKAVEAWVAANPDMAWMANAEAAAEKAGGSWFVVDVARRFRNYGEVSERQVAAVKAALVREAEFQARKQARDAERAAEEADRPHANAPTGRVTVTGRVMTVREPAEDAQFPAWKMLVMDDRGFKVWGTVPNSLCQSGSHYVSPSSVRGARVTFSATLEPSKDDPEFAFASRPTKASVVEWAPTEGSGK